MTFLPKHWLSLEENSISGAIDLAYEWTRQEGTVPSKQLAALARACSLDVVILADIAMRLSEDTQVNIVWALYNDEEGTDTDG